MTSSPEPQDPRKRLTWDEGIAVVVALTGIGTVFLWTLRSQSPGWEVSQWQSPFFPSPTASSKPPESSVRSAAPLSAVSPSPLAASVKPGAGSSTELDSNAALSIAPVPVPVTVTLSPTQTAKVPVGTVPSTAPASSAPEGAKSSPSPTVKGTPKAFVDVPVGFWASPYIAELSQRGILNGFADNTFKPNQPITRAEFARMVQQAFDQPKIKQSLNFKDIPDNYWAVTAIDEAIQTGFMSGYPKGIFKPDQQISRVQLQVALVTGLKLPPTAATPASAKYTDAEAVPKWATKKVATAIAAGIVVNDDEAAKLKSNQVATRAEAAALIYQALAKTGKVKPVGIP